MARKASSMSSNPSGDCSARSASQKPKAKPQSPPRQRDIRRALIEADIVDTALRDSAIPQSEAASQVLSKAKNTMVALPGQLFYSTQIPVCLWFLTKNKGRDTLRRVPDSNGTRSSASPPFRDRRGETLFIDARKFGTLIDRVHRELTDADLEKITSTYHAWRSDCSVVPPLGGSGKDRLKPGLQYADVPGFCKSATTAQITSNLHQSRTLATLRDTLPKLLSGELSVAKAVISPATE